MGKRICMRTIRTLLALLALAIPATLFGQLRVSISIGPPALPVYEQPVCPGDGYLWTPGYWAYDDSVSDYYWVDGQWVMAPEEGLLWTPGYWGLGRWGIPIQRRLLGDSDRFLSRHQLRLRLLR